MVFLDHARDLLYNNQPFHVYYVDNALQLDKPSKSCLVCHFHAVFHKVGNCVFPGYYLLKECLHSTCPHFFSCYFPFSPFRLFYVYVCVNFSRKRFTLIIVFSNSFGAGHLIFLRSLLLQPTSSSSVPLTTHLKKE